VAVAGDSGQEEDRTLNILFVHEVDWIRKVVFEIHTLSELLSLQGHNVYALDYESMWEQGPLPDIGTWRTTSTTVARAYPKASVYLVRPGFIKIPILSRLSAFITHYRVLEHIIRERRIDVIILYSAPTNGLQTIYWGRKLNVPIVFRSIDILHRLVTNPLLAIITRQIEKAVYSRVDSILTITPALARYVVRLGASRSKVGLVPLGVDTELFRPLPKDRELMYQLGFKEDDKIVVFAGTLPHFSGLDFFLKQLANAHALLPSVKLLIVGDGVQRQRLDNLIRELGLRKRVVITGFRPQEELPRYLSLADVCINPFVVSDTTRDIFPTKVIQYMACGKPVVSSELQGMLDMGLGVNQGVLYADDSGSMSQVVTAIINQQALGDAALQQAVKVHSYDKVVEQLEAELVSLVQRRRR
jgi:glycosyltransferase involved in cell wall biosynthesis